MAISITGDMRQKINGALADGYPCFVGTASADGKPQISMRGSVAVWLEKVRTGHFWETGVLYVDEQEEGEDDVLEVWGLLVERGLHEFVKKLRILEEAIQE